MLYIIYHLTRGRIHSTDIIQSSEEFHCKAILCTQLEIDMVPENYNSGESLINSQIPLPLKGQKRENFCLDFFFIRLFFWVSLNISKNDCVEISIFAEIFVFKGCLALSASPLKFQRCVHHHGTNLPMAQTSLKKIYNL